MTMILSIGASSTIDSNTWINLPWDRINKRVIRLQMRIAKAIKEERFGKVKALQRLLTCSFHAKCLAVKRATTSKGAKTPGIDNVVWRTSLQKIKAVLSLKRCKYRPLPLKRIYIPKKDKSKLRPISIPAMKDRAMQNLWHMALSPIAEIGADYNAYGFRLKRSAQDAIQQCYASLCHKTSAQYIFEGDIYSCFNNISHQWLLENILMDKVILKKFLKAGFMEKQKLYPTEAGAEQGNIISPTLALMALSGLERAVKSNFTALDRVHVIIYCDDFIITAKSKELITERIIPIVTKFLNNVGLELSEKKSKITHIDDGFDFLGFNVRKHNRKLLIKPSKCNVKAFLEEIKSTIKTNYAAKTVNLIMLLNSKIRGWSNYYRGAVSSRIFAKIDDEIFKSLWKWAIHRHPNKGRFWIVDKYFTRYRLSNWRFYAKSKDKEVNNKMVYLYKATDTPIRRHIKVIGAAQPFDNEFRGYFEKRDQIKRCKLQGIRY